MEKIEKYEEIIFENIKHVDENGVEYWEARELMSLLEYKKWENFYKAINKAIIAWKTSNNRVDDHFSKVGKTIKMPKGASKLVDDYKLSRYACYLIVQKSNNYYR